MLHTILCLCRCISELWRRHKPVCTSVFLILLSMQYKGLLSCFKIDLVLCCFSVIFYLFIYLFYHCSLTQALAVWRTPATSFLVDQKKNKKSDLYGVILTLQLPQFFSAGRPSCASLRACVCQCKIWFLCKKCFG